MVILSLDSRRVRFNAATKFFTTTLPIILLLFKFIKGADLNHEIIL